MKILAPRYFPIMVVSLITFEENGKMYTDWKTLHQEVRRECPSQEPKVEDTA
jgi:hypothetical protein